MKHDASKRSDISATLPTLETERLTLRFFEPEDAEDVFSYAQSENVGPMAGWAAHKTLEESRRVVEMFRTDGDVWAVVEKKSGHVIGTIGLHKRGRRSVERTRELGYVLGENYWGQGYATEACGAVLDYAFFGLDCSVVSVAHFPFNERSKNVIQKLGFIYEGRLRRALTLPDGSDTDELIYSMLKEEYMAAKGEAVCLP